jgi:hypothetical protein
MVRNFQKAFFLLFSKGYYLSLKISKFILKLINRSIKMSIKKFDHTAKSRIKNIESAKTRTTKSRTTKYRETVDNSNMCGEIFWIIKVSENH